MINKAIDLKYTVLMSVYHKEKPEYLRTSVNSMLNQTVPPDEFIIVKDGPLSPGLDEVIDEFVSEHPGLFTVITNEVNLGLGPSLAKGVAASGNELIARMDSDDYSAADRCEKQLAKFMENPQLGIVGSYGAEFIESVDHIVSVHKLPAENQEIEKMMHRRCAILHPTVIFRKSAVLKSGNYHPVLLYEDYDLFSRMVLEQHIISCNIPEPLYFVRTSSDFFKRRGGIRYAKTALRFKWRQYKKGYMTMEDFCISGLGQAFVCILPNAFRKAFYLKFLRG